MQEGWTALMAAANNGRLGTTDVLLQNKANPDMQDDVSYTTYRISSNSLRAVY